MGIISVFLTILPILSLSPGVKYHSTQMDSLLRTHPCPSPPLPLPPPQLFESLQAGDYPVPLSRPAAAYEEALQLVKEGKVLCRTLR